ncbi:MAG: hypothetical protein KGK18_09510, partial [Burkholderiales bacterium]|nr:hypothetical protein [Burkholderiales bacterium]
MIDSVRSMAIFSLQSQVFCKALNCSVRALPVIDRRVDSRTRRAGSTPLPTATTAATSEPATPATISTASAAPATATTAVLAVKRIGAEDTERSLQRIGLLGFALAGALR